MNNEQSERSLPTSAYTSRLSSGSRRYFDFLDCSHSVFSKESYYDDMRKTHPWLRRPYSRYSGIAYSTLGGGPCSIRTEELARPRIKRERLIRQEFFDNATNYAYSGVKSTALTAQCSDRLSRLARPKKTPIGYLFAYDLPRPVPKNALQARPSDRIESLAKPRENRLNRAQSLWQPR